MSKWPFGGEQERIPSDASRFNDMLLKKLQRALNKDPEANLADLFPSDYASRLAGKKTKGSDELHELNSSSPTATHCHSLPNDDRHAILHIYPLSASVSKLLQIFGSSSQDTGDSFAQRLGIFLQRSESLWVSEACANHRVVRHADVVVKIVPNIGDYTEYTSMLYLEKHHPEIPAPRPKGLLATEATAYIFMSYIPGITLNRVWKNLCEGQKISIRNQLDQILLKLRDFHHPEGMPLGGVREEGCKDTRRHTRYSKAPIFNDAGFDDFIFSNPHFGSPVYIKTLRQLAARQPSRLCFCHGDLRPDNIVVQVGDEGKYQVTGLLDWEKSGFYPEYF